MNNLYFWRDQKGHEVDLVEDRAGYLYPIEINLSETFNSSFIDNIEFLNSLQIELIPIQKDIGTIIFSGEGNKIFKNVKIEKWREYFIF